MWTDIVCVLFACVAANHLGLIDAIKEVLGREIPIVGCAKCLTFWMTLPVCLLHHTGIVRAAAISLLSAYLTIWLELFMGFIDKKFEKLYDTIYSTTTTTDADADGTVSCKGYTDSPVSDL